MDARIIEEKIYAATGRVVDGKSVIEEIERAAGNSEETGSVWLTGEDSLKERWEYWVDLTRKYDEEEEEWSDEIQLLEISIFDKKTKKTFNVEFSEQQKQKTICLKWSYAVGNRIYKDSVWYEVVIEVKSKESRQREMIRL